MAWRKRFIHGRVGTLEWMAPEILVGNQKYGPPIDVYSFSILMWYVDLSVFSFLFCNMFFFIAFCVTGKACSASTRGKRFDMIKLIFRI